MSKRNNKKLQTLQNSITRIIFQLPQRTNTDSYHCILNTLHQVNRIYYFLMIFMDRKSREANLSPFNTHSVNTRLTSKLTFLQTRTRSAKITRSYLYQGISLWNELSIEEQFAPTVDAFKRMIGNRLLTSELQIYTELFT